MRTWVLFLILIAGSPSSATEIHWDWIKAGYTTNEWFVQQGKAEVSIEGDKFYATLFEEGSYTEVQITLAGTIENGKIKVTEIIHGSDYTGSKYEGTLKRRGGSGTSVAESINLSDGWSMVGIKRNLPK